MAKPKTPLHILDPRFKYAPSFATDVAATFRRARREQDKKALPTAPVLQIKKRSASC